ncbi:MAG: OmpH family outer membrane protein [Lewinella sp.]|nr:OmpH family outer membrane protein [Lewinella sp.]
MRTASWLVLSAGLLAACQPSGSNDAPAGTTEVTPGSGKIVFIRVDSITNQYEALADKLDALQTKMSEAEQRQNERIAAFQRDVQNFQRRAQSGQMAPRDIGQEQERLAGREQGLVEERDRVLGELQTEQLQLMAGFEKNVKAVLAEIQDEFGYDYILNYSPGTGVLMVNDAFDITPEVVKRLNALPASDLDAAVEEAEDEVADDAATDGE